MKIKEIRNQIQKKFPRLWKWARKTRNRLRKKLDLFPVLRLGEMLRAIQFNKRIDMVERDGFLLFCYAGDHFHRVITPNKNKRRTYKDFKTVSRLPSVTASGSLKEYMEAWNGPGQADFYLLVHMLGCMEKFAVVDVGCLYGYTSLAYARFLRDFGSGNRVISVDPGFGAELAPFNFKNNGYDRIEFYPYAAGNYDGYLPVHAEPGQNENNRIVRPGNSGFSVSKIRRGITLDRFLTEINCGDPLFIKIDTQGAEPEVFEGLKNTINSRAITGLFEFFPAGYRDRLEPEDFLDHILAQFDVFDLGPSRNRLNKLKPGNSRAFVEEIDNQRYSWTDLLFISPDYPGREGLINDLSNGKFQK